MSSAEAQLLGCHHPTIAATKHSTVLPATMTIVIQYRIGAMSL
jgi:hypothetical protein